MIYGLPSTLRTSDLTPYTSWMFFSVMTCSGVPSEWTCPSDRSITRSQNLEATLRSWQMVSTMMPFLWAISRRIFMTYIW